MAFTSSLTRNGNSESVVIPKPLRDQLGVSAPDRVSMDSPRPGVVVIRFVDGCDRRRVALEAAEDAIRQLSKGKEWPVGKSAEDIVAEARAERTHGSYPL